MRTPRPENEADDHGDACADGHVDEADLARVPSLRHDDVHREHDEHGERHLPDRERKDPAGIGGKEHERRKQDPWHHRRCADEPQQGKRREEADRGADYGFDRRLPSASTLVRKTASAPSTTQNPCWKSNAPAMSSADADRRAGAQRVVEAHGREHEVGAHGVPCLAHR